MKNIIIGTAGHVDHGKTTLIKALTGQNTDRLAEEQRRGITIELGFAHFNLPNGDRAGIVDVPGHEKFIHNMAAGVVGMDLVLVVIAADEGIMPQTREHLDILKLLGVEKYIFVLNKCDLVNEEWLEMVEAEIREELSNPVLKDTPIVRVSAVTGEGIPALVEEIQRMTAEMVREKETAAEFPRLPVDRVFTMPGFGKVVTGTLISGTIDRESRLEIYPYGKECRLRGIQVYGEEQERCWAGQRVALNLSNVKKEELRRGCVLAPVHSMKNTTLLDVKLEILPYSTRILKNRTRLHLYTGTSEVLCRAVLLETETLKPGESGYVQLRLEEEIAVRQGDKFIVRFYSPMETIGGGVVLDPNPGIKKRFRQEVIEALRQKENGSSKDVIELQIRSQKETLFTVEELTELTVFSMEEIQHDVQELADSGQIYCFPVKRDVYVWHRFYAEKKLKEVQKALTEYQQEYPYRYGIKSTELQNICFKQIKLNVFAQILEMWEEQGKLRIWDVQETEQDRLKICKTQVSERCTEEFVTTVEFEPLRDETFAEVSEWLTDRFQKAGYEFVKYSETIPDDILGVSKAVMDDICRLMCEDGSIVKVCDGCYSLTGYMDEAGARITEMLSKNPIITISQVRDAFGTSRRCAKQILEYTDRMKITQKTSAESEWTIGTEV